MQEIGTIKAIYRYPVKSMAGEPLTSAELGWHGIEGDRRYAFMRTESADAFPWLIASKMRELVTYKAYYRKDDGASQPRVRVRTPAGEDFELDSEPLLQQLSGAFGSSLKLANLVNGIFDDAPLSLISTETIKALEAETGRALDIRRFRPNLLIEPCDGNPLRDDEWIGKTLLIGSAPNVSAVRVTIRDIRCVMVNIDPDTAAVDPLVFKTIVHNQNNCAGVYGSTFKPGTISVGDRVCAIENA